MSRVISILGRPVRVPALAAVLVALSALVGNLAQWEYKDDLKAQVNANNAQAECRSRIVGYVDGLDIDSRIAQGDGLLDRLGDSNDAIFEQAIADYRVAVGALKIAKEYREQAVEVCAADPAFDPDTDIVEGGP